MSKKKLYEIRNLICSYDGTREVLKIKELDIYRGQIVVLLGVSGAGKSTILETLGLMNNTIKLNGGMPETTEQPPVLFYPEGDKPIDFAGLWKKPDYKELARVRRDHFSFIFQHTNLMPSFTAFENIGITQMIEGKSKEEAISKAKQAAEELGLKINEKKKAYELSGGERQRAAFIRAITPGFSVLFGDEPTGNLDECNSEILLELTKKTIKENHRTAIIVSHNIDLAITYGDQIIVIKNHIINNNNSYGEIIKDFIFSCEGKDIQRKWFDHKGNDVTSNIKKKIKGFLVDNNQKKSNLS